MLSEELSKKEKSQSIKEFEEQSMFAFPFDEPEEEEQKLEDDMKTDMVI